MSALAYHEPYKFSAALLTLLVHAAFFALLYFGVNWQVKQPEGMEVELWQSLPEAENAAAPPGPPVAEAAPPARQQQAEQPAPPAHADIEMQEKKKKPPVKPKEQVKPEPKKTPTKAERQQALKEMQALDRQQDLADQQEQARREAQAARAAQQAADAKAAAAAVKGEVDKYTGLIRSKIRRYIVMPPDVEDDAEAEFIVTLLPTGELLDVKQVKPSGNGAYDTAVERAINKAQPLPLPQDEAARKQFINPHHLRLKFSPKITE